MKKKKKEEGQCLVSVGIRKKKEKGASKMKRYSRDKVTTYSHFHDLLLLPEIEKKGNNDAYLRENEELKG